MRATTLVFPQNDRGELLFGLKKRGLGANKYNGFGGKIEDGETFRQCAIRELFEESSLLAKESALTPIAYLYFAFPYTPELSHGCYVYTLSEFEGIPLESEEMIPQWIDSSHLPYDQMWKGDCTWIPHILKGEFVLGRIEFAEDIDSVSALYLDIVPAITEKEHLEDETLEKLLSKGSCII